MKIRTYFPCDILKPFVSAYTIVETLQENTFKVLPDTGLVLGFQFKGRLSHLAGDKELLLDSAGVTGLSDHYKIFKNEAGTGTLLVYFKEAGAAQFFRQPLHELFRESVSLDNFMLRSELLLLEEQLHEAKTDPAKIQVIERFLIARLNVVEPDRLVIAALEHIHKNKGNIRIAELARALHTSQSPLEKKFRQAVGASPKKFASVVRLKHTIQNYQAGDSLTALGYEAGFYDQAHFISAFKIFTGETPELFLRKDPG